MYFCYLGSYNCKKVECEKGYRPSKWREGCSDIDECATNETVCLQNETCVNTMGGYLCDCQPGYHKVNGDCIDIDECLLGSRCSLLTTTCVNTDGGFRCECRTGFTRNPDASPTDVCHDIDECLVDGACDSSAICNNNHGGHTCICEDPDMTMLANGTCIFADNESCYGIWETQADGKRKCTCPHGFEMDGTKKSCRDINECEYGLGMCPESSVCVNTFGDFKCPSIKCPPKYAPGPSNTLVSRILTNSEPSYDHYLLF